MILFLTSSPGGYPPSDRELMASPVSERNGLRERMRAAWPERPAKVVAVASDPDNKSMNEGMKANFRQMFSESGLPVAGIDIIDRDTAEELDMLLKDCDVLILCGGHVPTENRFFAELDLREEIRGYDGIVIGISAGTMNSADTVYAQPELPGESEDPEYRRYLPGLGLTKKNILPHYQDIKDDILDGKRLFEDITYPDSFGHTFYALEDGSYLFNDGTGEIICGRAYEIRDGQIRPFCGDGETLPDEA